MKCKLDNLALILFIFIIFLLDIFTPVQIILGKLYFIAQFYCLYRNLKKQLVVVGITSVFLIFLGLCIDLFECDNLFHVFNRSLTALLLTFFSFLGYKFLSQVEEVKRQEEDLIKTNEELKQFAYVASHDLKAPLRAVASLSTWIIEDLKEGKDITEYVDKMKSRIRHMNDLIDGLLELSRVGRINVEKERIELNSFLIELINNLSTKQFKITVDEMPVVFYNRTRLGQIFSNLIENAIKHHPQQDGKIEISVKELNNCYEFCIIDDGDGFEQKYHDKIFQIFQTLKSNNGTGLGLTLIKKIIEDNGGKIWAKSEIGYGAKFYFTVLKGNKNG